MKTIHVPTSVESIALMAEAEAKYAAIDYPLSSIQKSLSSNELDKLSMLLGEWDTTPMPLAVHNVVHDKIIRLGYKRATKAAVDRWVRANPRNPMPYESDFHA